MTTMVNFKRLFITLSFVLTLICGINSDEAFASNVTPQTIAYVEADGKFVNLDGADANAIAGRFVQSSVDNGYIYLFSKVKNASIKSAVKMLEKEVDVDTKNIKDIEDIDATVLNQAASYLNSEQFSVMRIEIEEKSHESADQKWQKWLAYGAAAAAIISAFK